MARGATRQDDDLALAILALPSGSASADFAVKHGLSASYASVLRQRVMADDLAASPSEDPDAIRAAYGFKRFKRLKGV